MTLNCVYLTYASNVDTQQTLIFLFRLATCKGFVFKCFLKLLVL